MSFGRGFRPKTSPYLTVYIQNQTALSLQSVLDLHYSQQRSWSRNPFPNAPFSDRPNFTEAEDDNLNVANKRFQDTGFIENIVNKGEIAHFEQFHLFPQYFPRGLFLHCIKLMSIYQGKGSLKGYTIVRETNQTDIFCRE